MKLIEIVRGDQDTSDETVASSPGLRRLPGKDPILVKDVPGFATSRLGVLLGSRGHAHGRAGRRLSAADIDKAMELGYRHPMGPLKLTDLVGLDVRLAIAEHLQQGAGHGRPSSPRSLLRDMVAAGKLGKKSGEGFYTVR